jgi:hypothetical protein
MRRWTPVVLAAALGLAFALPALAQWKWRDKGGQTQYSDLPPPAGTADQDILQRPNSDKRRAAPPSVAASGASAAATSAPLLAPRGSEPELEARRRKAEQDEAAKKTAEDARQAAGRADNCTRAKAQLRTIDSGIRMTRANEKGEREFLDDAARAAEAQRARAVIASDCK